MIRYIAIIAALFVSQAAWSDPARPELADRPDIHEVSTEDAEMNAAIAEAQKTLPEFLKVVKSNDKAITEISFKFPLGGWEHIWVDNVKIDGDYLTGKLSNEPAQTEYQMGDDVRVAKSEVSDWTYRSKDGVMQGARTTRVLLPMLDPEEAAGIKEFYKW